MRVFYSSPHHVISLAGDDFFRACLLAHRVRAARRMQGRTPTMPSVRALSLLLAGASRVAAECGSEYGNCYDSHCCISGNFGCKRRTGRPYAQCRPLPGGICEEEEGWECPGWELCGEKYQPCLSTKCCKDNGFGCYRKPEADYAQCRPIASMSGCTDTPDWLCPGWELCSDPYQECTTTHCCSDHRFVCYEKGPHFAQCLKRGTCVAGRDGTCVEASNELGHCTAPYHDCHLTGCCQRGEDHCYLKNPYYGQCRPSCNAAEVGHDWSCARHELPSERNKVTCETLRHRTNINRRPCSTQYESEQQCTSTYSLQGNVYMPCAWHADSNACVESGQGLDCDCQLRHLNCPHHEQSNAPGAADNGVSGAVEEASDGEEGLVITVAIIIIIGGCAGLGW